MYLTSIGLVCIIEKTWELCNMRIEPRTAVKADVTITQLIFINLESKLGWLVISQNSFKIIILFQ